MTLHHQDHCSSSPAVHPTTAVDIIITTDTKDIGHYQQTVQRQSYNIHHHHRGRAPDWSVAVSTSCFHRPQSWASRQAEFRPWLSGWRSASMARCDVDVLGGASSPWVTHESTYIGLWIGLTAHNDRWSCFKADSFSIETNWHQHYGTVPCN